VRRLRYRLQAAGLDDFDALKDARCNDCKGTGSDTFGHFCKSCNGKGIK
jgi:DnaJ-class molecular chaperone